MYIYIYIYLDIANNVLCPGAQHALIPFKDYFRSFVSIFIVRSDGV